MKRIYQAPRFKVNIARVRHTLLSGSIETGPSTGGSDGEATVKGEDNLSEEDLYKFFL